MDNERLEASREQYLRNPESHASKVAYINALEYELSQAQSNVPVACGHEPYHGKCIHCGIVFVNGKPAAPQPQSVAEPVGKVVNEGGKGLHAYFPKGLPPAGSSLYTEPQPQSVAAALEEAAEACDYLQNEVERGLLQSKNMARMCANKIRALIKESEGK